MVQRLLVEGTTDMHVIANLCKTHLSPPKGYETEKKFRKFVQLGESINGVKEQIPVLLKQSGLTNLGIVVDADENPQGRWESIRNILNKAGYLSLPKEPNKEGLLINHVIGVWIMPNNQSRGYLEHFVEGLIPENDQLFERAKNTTEKLKQDQIAKFKELAKQKADIHTWLAWQETPGLPIGMAISAGYFDAKASTASPFIAWMKKTFQY